MQNYYIKISTYSGRSFNRNSVLEVKTAKKINAELNVTVSRRINDLLNHAESQLLKRLKLNYLAIQTDASKLQLSFSKSNR